MNLDVAIPEKLQIILGNECFLMNWLFNLHSWASSKDTLGCGHSFGRDVISREN